MNKSKTKKAGKIKQVAPNKAKLKDFVEERKVVQKPQNPPIIRKFNCRLCYLYQSATVQTCNTCKICDTCQDQWFSQQIINQQNNPLLTSFDQFSIQCGGCSQAIRGQNKVLLANLPQVGECLTKFYIRKNSQYYYCPSSTCSYIGWMEDKNCQELICNLCQTKWQKHQGSVTNLKKFKFSEILTNLFKLLFTKNCPSCKAPIHKMGGCKKMRCSNCSHYFCWKCKDVGHYDVQLKCFLICLFQCLLVLIPLNTFIYQIGLYQPALNQLKEFFTFQNFFYDYGFLYLLQFLFRLVYKNGLAILIPLNIFERNLSIIFRILLVVDIILWFIFTRWMEVLYYLMITPQIVISLILFFD